MATTSHRRHRRTRNEARDGRSRTRPVPAATARAAHLHRRATPRRIMPRAEESESELRLVRLGRHRAEVPVIAASPGDHDELADLRVERPSSRPTSSGSPPEPAPGGRGRPRDSRPPSAGGSGRRRRTRASGMGLPITSGRRVARLDIGEGTPRNEPWWKSIGPASIRVKGTVTSCSGRDSDRVPLVVLEVQHRLRRSGGSDRFAPGRSVRGSCAG